MGHSYRCNKVIYHYYKRWLDVLGLILESAPNMLGSYFRVRDDYYLHLDLLKSKVINCKRFDYKCIKGVNHFYVNKEKKLVI